MSNEMADRPRPSTIPSVHLEFTTELALIATILLCHFFLLVLSELPRWKDYVGASKEVAVNVPTIMSLLIAVMYIFSIPRLVSRVIILGNADAITLLHTLGGAKSFIADEMAKAFLQVMKGVAIKALVSEATIYGVLVLGVSSVYHYLVVDFPRVVVLSLASIILFSLFSVFMLRLELYRFIRKISS
jgi:hypothetical protein